MIWYYKTQSVGNFSQQKHHTLNGQVSTLYSVNYIYLTYFNLKSFTLHQFSLHINIVTCKKTYTIYYMQCHPTKHQLQGPHCYFHCVTQFPFSHQIFPLLHKDPHFLVKHSQLPLATLIAICKLSLFFFPFSLKKHHLLALSFCQSRSPQMATTTTTTEAKAEAKAPAEPKEVEETSVPSLKYKVIRKTT